MTKLSTAQRRNLHPDEYVFPEKAPGPCSLPIPDSDHAKAALGLCGNCGPGACDKTKAAVSRRFPSMATG
jgi:hypothetical protein